ETENASLERWVNDEAGLKAYASGLGFEHCNVQRSQIAKDNEIEKATDPEASDAANEHAITIIADKFVVTPVTTPLERSLLGDGGRDADRAAVCVLLSANAFPLEQEIDDNG